MQSVLRYTVRARGSALQHLDRMDIGETNSLRIGRVGEYARAATGIARFTWEQAILGDWGRDWGGIEVCRRWNGMALPAS
jgi:hypothetical protein